MANNNTPQFIAAILVGIVTLYGLSIVGSGLDCLSSTRANMFTGDKYTFCYTGYWSGSHGLGQRYSFSELAMNIVFVAGAVVAIDAAIVWAYKKYGKTEANKPVANKNTEKEE